MMAPGEPSTTAKYRQAAPIPQPMASAALPSRPMICRETLAPPPPCLAHHVWKQAEEPGPLDGPGQLALFVGGYGGDPARHDLASLRDEALQQTHVLVVDLGRVRDREPARFAPAKEWPTGAATTTATAGRRRSGLAFHLSLQIGRAH